MYAYPPPLRLTAGLLAEAIGRPVSAVVPWLEPVRLAARMAELASVQRMAAFLAQVGHESGGFRHVREIWGPTPAQTRYEGRADLGNTQPGDGFRYRGRGLIQITGRANYARVTERLKGMGAPDFIAQPEALEVPRWAAASAADYWRDRGLNRYADSGDFRTLTRRINGGYNGFEDRLRRLERATRTLQGA